MVRHFLFESSHFFKVAAEKVDLVQLSAGSAFKAAHRVVLNEVFQCAQASCQFLREHGEALS